MPLPFRAESFRSCVGRLGSLSALLGLLAACTTTQAPVAAKAQATVPSADSQYSALARAIIDDHLRRYPSSAADLGVHRYDDQIEDMSQAAIRAESSALRGFKARLVALNTAGLSPDNLADREFLGRSLDAGILANDVIERWAKDPDAYSGGITNAAYVIMKRPFAPAADRLRSLIARERKMPQSLLDARMNLLNPPKIYTQIALEQIDGNIGFFKVDVPFAFAELKDAALLSEFQRANEQVVAALVSYKTWLASELLPRSNGSFAYGEETYRKALSTSEMIEQPLSELLQIAEADRARNEAQFQAVAKQIDPSKPAGEVLAALQADHPAPDALLATTQATLDSLRQFIVDHRIITIPKADPARVQETPPFMRSTTSASMDTPGPFEPAALEGRYNMTLPDPRWPKAKQNEFMGQWYFAAISNVSVHEVYPGHYTQFLYAKGFPSDVRKVYGASTNVEGWAHYAEQMVLDEGFHASEPKYRLAELQDALLRDLRFTVGIQMHTRGMSVEQAADLFATQGHQPRPVAESEAKRGTSDALYGYYTMGKLMIQKLCADYRAKLGASYSLLKFHDEFIKLGPLPLPLIRKAMLGEVGTLFPIALR
jgi:uncharacterized protein (DUF885 family)